MTDEQMADFLGFAKDEPKRILAVQKLAPEKRALFERMATVEVELDLWQQGLGPKPQGVLIDTERSTKRRKGWR